MKNILLVLCMGFVFYGCGLKKPLTLPESNYNDSGMDSNENGGNSGGCGCGCSG